MKIENTEVYGFSASFRGLRNPKNSWNMSDSYRGLLINSPNINTEEFILGEKDLKLAQTLIKAGTEHCKFMRQIQVWCDITAPRYFFQEFDTYKIGTSANSTSTMHKIMDRPIIIEDFELGEEIKEMLKHNKINTKHFFKCELPKGIKEEWKGIKGYEGLYKISNRSEIIRMPLVVYDSIGRVRHIPQKIVKPSPRKDNYLELNLRKDGLSTRYLLHRLMAETFIDNPNNLPVVNHKDGNKQNESLNNLEWVTYSENNKHAFDNDLKEVSNYAKTMAKVSTYIFNNNDINRIKKIYSEGLTQKEIAEQFNCKQIVISDIVTGKTYKDVEYIDIVKYMLQIIDKLNELRILYKETNDYDYVIAMKRILPESYLNMRTVNMNYAVIRNIIGQRKHHRLKHEWQNVFCKWATTLPYAKELIFCGIEDDYERLKGVE